MASSYLRTGRHVLYQDAYNFGYANCHADVITYMYVAPIPWREDACCCFAAGKHSLASVSFRAGSSSLQYVSNLLLRSEHEAESQETAAYPGSTHCSNKRQDSVPDPVVDPPCRLRLTEKRATTGEGLEVEACTERLTGGTS